MIKRLQSAWRYRTLLKEGDASLVVLEADGNQSRRQAQRLHASIYYKYGYLTADDIMADGRLADHEDPYQDHSRYFTIRDSTSDHIVASARLIEHSEPKGHASFQTLFHQELFPKYDKMLRDRAPHEFAEVSGLVKKTGTSTYATMLLYRAMWQHSLLSGQSVWLMSCDDKLYRRLRRLFGPALEPIGAKKFYKGHIVVPCMLELSKSLDVLLNSAGDLMPFRRSLKLELLRFFLTGIRSSVLNEKQRRTLRKLAVITT